MAVSFSNDKRSIDGDKIKQKMYAMNLKYRWPSKHCVCTCKISLAFFSHLCVQNEYGFSVCFQLHLNCAAVHTMGRYTYTHICSHSGTFFPFRITFRFCLYKLSSSATFSFSFCCSSSVLYSFRFRVSYSFGFTHTHYFMCIVCAPITLFDMFCMCSLFHRFSCVWS